MQNPYGAYEKQAIETLSKEDLVVKTFEELISQLNIAKIALENKDIKTKAESISKITKALQLLQASLDFEKGGEIAENLNKLYDFCLDQLTKANIENKVEYIQNVIDVLTPIYEGFKEARQKLNEGKTDNK